MKQLFSVFTLLGCFLLAACSFSTREDITPPPGIEQSVSQSPKTQTGDETESNPPITQDASPTPRQAEPLNPPDEIKTTQDISGLTITRMHLFFELTAQDMIQITQMVMIATPTKGRRAGRSRLTGIDISSNAGLYQFAIPRRRAR